MKPYLRPNSTNQHVVVNYMQSIKLQNLTEADHKEAFSFGDDPYDDEQTPPPTFDISTYPKKMETSGPASRPISVASCTNTTMRC